MQKRMEHHSGGLSLVFFKRCATEEPLPHFASQTSPSSWPTWHRKDAVCPNIGQTVRSASENQWISIIWMDASRKYGTIVLYSNREDFCLFRLGLCHHVRWRCGTFGQRCRVLGWLWVSGCDVMRWECAKSTHASHYAYIRGPLYFAASFPVWRDTSSKSLLRLWKLFFGMLAEPLFQPFLCKKREREHGLCV